MRSGIATATSIAALLLVLPSAAPAATIQVDRTDDPAGPGLCSAAPNDCSLEQAAEKADTDAAKDTIAIGAGEYFTSGIFLEYPVLVSGAGARQTTLRTTGGVVLLFNGVEPGIESEIADVKITGARNEGPSYGGGIFASDTRLTLRRVAIVDNQDGAHTETAQLYPAWGGGVFAFENVTIIDSLIAENRATVEDNGTFATGGGLRLYGANNVIRNSTIADNVAIGATLKSASGAGISLAEGGGLKLENVTLAGNVLSGDATSQGANLATEGSVVVRARNSIFADGLPVSFDSCDAEVISEGGNLDDDSSCGLTAGTDRPGVDPLLGRLADNGGPTDTMALGLGSPAIDFAGSCGLATDQRGLPRPSGACDSGAYELQPPPPVACKLKASSKAGSLKARVTCDSAATLSLAGIATIWPRRHKGKAAHGKASTSRRGKKPKPKRVALGPVTASAAAGQALTVPIPLPKKVRRAVKAGKRVSAKLSLAARTAAGAETAGTAKVSRLKKKHRKKAPRPKHS